MTIEQIKEILTGSFAIESEREYWQRKLEELEAKQERAKNNEKYFAEMQKYSR